MKTNPVAWAKEMIRSHGLTSEDPDNPGAIEITQKYAREMIGSQNDVKNPHYPFYLEALNWMRKLK